MARALRAPHPFELLAYVSSLLNAFDPRSRDPFDRADAPPVSLDELMATFLEVEAAETTALLTVIGALTDDELLRARIGREVAARSHPLPSWLTELDRVQVTGTAQYVEPLGDGDDITIGCLLPSAAGLTAIVYIDHNMGTLVKDAFFVPESFNAVVEHMRERMVDPDIEMRPLDTASARARVSDAITTGAQTYPPVETDSWPACRPLLEWLVRKLPAGGIGYPVADWPTSAREALADDFFNSSHGRDLDGPDARGLFETLSWFACDYGAGDPLRWSPVAVEIALNWLPAKMIADADYLAAAPASLRALIRYAHAQRDVAPHLTDQTLAAVDRWEPEYLATIRSGRRSATSDAAARLLAAGVFDAVADDEIDDLDEQSVEEIMLESLARKVGSPQALDQLDDEPLPDEPFDWTGIPDDIHDTVVAVLELTDRCCEELLDVEHRTATRRLLARCASRRPEVMRRRARNENTAAAICWLVGKANDTFATYYGAPGILVKDILTHLGLKQTGVSQRANALLAAGGFDTDHYRDITLGADFLVSRRRARIIANRDRYRSSRA